MRTAPAVAGFEDEGRDMSQRTQVVPQSWKRQETDRSPEPPGSPADASVLAQGDPTWMSYL